MPYAIGIDLGGTKIEGVVLGDDCFVVASEPYDDDPGWADVPDYHLVDVADGVVTVTELEA